MIKVPHGARAKAVLDYITDHPGCNTADISASVGQSTTKVATIIWAEMKRKQPRVTRYEIKPHIYVYARVGVDPGLHVMNRPAPEPEPEPQLGMLIEKTLLPDELARLLPQPEPAPVGAQTTKPLDVIVDELAQAIAVTISSRVMQHVTEQLGMLMPTTIPVLEPITLEQLTARVLQKPSLAKKKPTVLIAGLLPNQAGIIQTEFGDVFDLRFFETNDNLRLLKDMVRHVDHVFTFTSKIGHDVQEMIKSTGKPIYHCSGGITMLKDLLLKLYAEGVI